jgi:hypothetical protein
MTTPDNAAAVRRLEDEALEFTRQLIRIESVNTGDLATIGDGETRAAVRTRRRPRCSPTRISTSCPWMRATGPHRPSAPRCATDSCTAAALST